MTISYDISKLTNSIFSQTLVDNTRTTTEAKDSYDEDEDLYDGYDYDDEFDPKMKTTEAAPIAEPAPTERIIIPVVVPVSEQFKSLSVCSVQFNVGFCRSQPKQQKLLI